MITSRDLKVVDFLTEYKIASTSTIKELFYPSLRVCQRRLLTLVEEKHINRLRVDLNTDYLYYLKKPKQIKHALLVTDFYRELNKLCSIKHFKTEVSLGDIRPDALIGYTLKDKNFIILLEIEISNKGFDISKYERFYASGEYKNYFPVMPTIYAVTDRNIKNTTLPLQKIPTKDIGSLGVHLGIR